MIYGFLIVVHVIISILLVVAVLMQRSKGGGLAGIAGGAASTPFLGGRETATLLHKVTIILAVVFGLNCLLLGILSKGRSAPHSVVQESLESEEFPLDFLGSQGATDSGLPTQGTPAPAQEAGNNTAPTSAPQND